MDVELECDSAACASPPESTDDGRYTRAGGNAKGANGRDGGCAIVAPRQASTRGSWLGVLAGAVLALGRKCGRPGARVRYQPALPRSRTSRASTGA